MGDSFEAIDMIYALWLLWKMTCFFIFLFEIDVLTEKVDDFI